ncbi:sulfite exporter TauE/SafE family protein [Candidatus Woesearchaeota archaeon]|nr:sulfite exporter TauE/SafE family protein [Candidatus Woesearchaeota archaeon]
MNTKMMKKSKGRNDKSIGMTELPEAQRKFRIRLVIAAFVLFAIVLFAFIYLSTTPEATATMLLSFAGGVSNIVLPCTLPLVFIIVPIAMLAGRKGIAMTMLFGLGLIITLAVYGAVVALIGQYLGLDIATRVMYSLAGIASLIFGLTELKLIKFELPSYVRMPKFIQERGDYIKVFMLGLLLGNAGVGCPNPITYVVLVFAATSGNWLQGAALMAINGLGRAVPLLLLTILGILGVNTIGWLAKKSESIKKFTAWALVVLGSFILLNGIFGHLWYEGGFFHEGLNAAFMAAGGKMIGEADIEIDEFEKPVPFMEYGAWLNLAVTLLPVFWYWRKYPKARKEVLIVLLIFLIWDLLLFDFGLSAMKWLAIEGGLP